DHTAEVERKQGNRRCRKNTGDDGVAARRRDTSRKRVLELRSRGARIPADEDPAASGPFRCGPPEPLDELGGQVLADHATDAVRAEVLSRQALPLAELGRLARFVQARLLPLDDASVTREEPCALERDPQLGIGLDERAGNAMPDGAGLAARASAVDTDADVVGAFYPRDLKRSERSRAVRLPREVVLDRAAVEPGRAVTRAQDHAGDRGLPLARAAILRDLAHRPSSHVRGFGACGPCGCSGPA